MTSAAMDRNDVNGIFLAQCRHEVPDIVIGENEESINSNLHFQDVEKGEKLKYADTVIREMRARFPNSLLIVGYDIACKLAAHLKVKTCG